MRYLVLILCLTFYGMQTFGSVSKCSVLKAVEYHGIQGEKKLNDLLRADYHYALSQYYQNRDQAGFMALERFELALQRAIGDIRSLAYIKDPETRKFKATEASHNWKAAFKRAQIKNTPAPVV